MPGPTGIKRYCENYLTSFPDMTLTLRDLVAEGDTVVAHVDVAGTHEGEFLGIPATHRRGSTRWVTGNGYVTYAVDRRSLSRLPDLAGR